MEPIYNNLQEVYEAQRAYFSRPGADFAYDHDEWECYYRTRDDRKCAVGCLIPPDLYSEDLEGLNVDAALSMIPGVFGPEVLAGNNEWLTATQRIHDNLASKAVPISKFVEALDELACKRGLTVVTT